MRLRSYQTWKLQYLFVSPEQWARDHETHFWLKQYEVLDVHAATLVLRDVAQRDPAFLATLVGQTFGARGFDKQRTLQDFIQGLGRQRVGDKELPRFAWLYVARRRRERVAVPIIDPWKEVREAVQAAEQAPRGWVAVEVVSDAGAPISNLRLELLLADGEMRTLTTNSQGMIRLDSIPQGQCHVRVPDLDGSSWRPAEGSASSRVDGGRNRRHVVRQGECLARIAHNYGINDWKMVWNGPGNEGLRKKRKNPNVLFPGDEVAVPGPRVHEVVRATDQQHRIVVLGSPRVTVRINLLDEKRRSVEDAPCKIFVKDQQVFEGKAKGGQLEFELPVTVSEVRLLANVGGLQVERLLKIGALDPADQISGVQARLRNLGWYEGEIDGQESRRLTAAAREFRKATGLNPADELDQSLFDALEQEHLV